MNNQTYTPNEEPPRRKGQAFKIWIPTLALLILALFLIISTNQGSVPKSPDMTPAPGNQNALELLLYTELPNLVAEVGHEGWVLDEVQFNQDYTQALLWIAEHDDEGDNLIAREPEIVLALWDSAVQQWQLHMVTDVDFSQIFLESDFKDSEIAVRLFPDADPKAGPTGNVYGGYKLPWKGGLTKRLTWSVGHTSCNPQYYCNYAFDFADGTMFDIMASKGGYVYHWRDTCANGNSSCTNSITLEDRTTTPWTYQIYLHLAQSSIPAALKTKGVFVSQGQFIGKADDTGASTAHHLHFMVVQQQTLTACTYYCFGRAEDITFNDVTINWHAGTQGGRPRLEAEALWYGGQGQKYYISGNAGMSLPYKIILFPLYKDSVK
ncbi:MAG: M23 family metallopeptidase [Anaerolineaceae bacterium]|nr:M23 family metallopeptidase [Anaerolineaceae bacterium]MDD4043805.1 M23 family metallopeptidase [Anaerolineaceae bacterium]